MTRYFVGFFLAAAVLVSILAPFATVRAQGLEEGDLQAVASQSLNPAGLTKPTDLIGRAIRLLMAFIGSISLILYIWSGILWMTAAGNAERTGKAKTIMMWTTLGLLVMLSSYVLVNFVFDIFK